MELRTRHSVGGKLTFHLGFSNDVGIKVLQLENGKILFGGYYLSGISGGEYPIYEIAVVRLIANGNFDTTYGVNGLFHENIFTEGRNYLVDMVLQTDGKLLVLANVIHVSIAGYGLLRVTENGQLDTTFGNGGKIFQDPGNTTYRMSNILIQSDSKILVSGYTFNGYYYIARYLNSLLAVEEVKNMNVALYPNPTSDQITLEWKGPNKNYEAEIYNMVGQKVMTSKVSNKSSINVSTLVKGSYFVKLIGEGKATMLQFIKK